MRNRREVERERGYDQVRGTFASVFAAAAAEGISAADVRRALSDLKVRPVITAHPTEAKRVTVLERHRRIYLRLLELESPRWTERERQELIEALAEEIELLWLTGELKLQKPTVEQEVAWGLYFFNENLFDVVPQLLAKVGPRLRQAVPGRAFEIPLVLPVRFLDRRGSGRQSVRHQRGHAADALARRGSASLQRYRSRLFDLVRNLSIEDQALELPESFRAAVAEAIESVPRGRGARGAQSRRDLPPVRRLHDARTRPSPSRAPIGGAAGSGAGRPRLCERRPADRGYRSHAQCPRGGRRDAPGRCAAAAAAPGGRHFPLQHRAPRRAREQHARESDAGRHVSRPARRRGAAAAPSPRSGSRGCGRSSAHPAAEPLPYDGLPAEAAETLETFRTIAPHARRNRSRGVRRADPQHDPQRRRHPGRLSAREGGRAVRRYGRRRALHPAHRAPARDHPGSAPGRAHSQGAAWPCRWCSGASTCRAKFRKS